MPTWSCSTWVGNPLCWSGKGSPIGGQGAPVEPPANGHFTQRGEHLTWALRPSWDSGSRLVWLNAHSPNIIHRSSFRPVMSMEFDYRTECRHFC